MRKSIFSVLAGVALVGGSLFLPRLAGFAGAADSGGGICSGRTDAGFGIMATAGGPGSGPSFSLDVKSDDSSHVTGSMTFEGYGYSFSTEQWCRIWQHRPEDAPESGMPYPAGAMTAHALGYAALGDGTTVFLRADVRHLADGTIIYRVRYQPAGSNGESPGGTTTTTAATTTSDGGTSTTLPATTTTASSTTATLAPLAGEEGGGDEGAWTWVTPKGSWLPLASMDLTGNVVYPASSTTTSPTTTGSVSSTTTSSSSTTTSPSVVGGGTTTTVPNALAGATSAGAAQVSATVTVPATNTGMPLGADAWRLISVLAGVAGLILLLPTRMRPSAVRVRRRGPDER